MQITNYGSAALSTECTRGEGTGLCDGYIPAEDVRAALSEGAIDEYGNPYNGNDVCDCTCHNSDEVSDGTTAEVEQWHINYWKTGY